MAAAEEEEDANHATLQLTILSAEGLRDSTSSFFPFHKNKIKSFVMAWVDPRLKKSTISLRPSKSPSWNHHLSFPLSSLTLHNPSSILTLQILFSQSPLHTQNARIVGSSSLSLSSIRTDTRIFTLQLWRPSGRAQGLLRVSAHISIPSSVGAFPFQGPIVMGIPVRSDPIGPVAEWNSVGESEYSATAPPLPAAAAADNARRNFLVGLLSGVVAAVLVGSAVV